METFPWAGNMDTFTVNALKTVSGLPTGDKFQIHQTALTVTQGVNFSKTPGTFPDFVLDVPGEGVEFDLFGGRRTYNGLILNQDSFNSSPVIGFTQDTVNDRVSIIPLQPGYAQIALHDFLGQLNRRRIYPGSSGIEIEVLEYWVLPDIVDPSTGDVIGNTALNVGETIEIAFYGARRFNVGGDFVLDPFTFPAGGFTLTQPGSDNNVRTVTAVSPGVFTVEAKTPRRGGRGRRQSHREVVRSFQLTIS